jgi:arylsulfatase A-like enzyme
VALTDADREQIVALYDGEIRFVDEYVGRLVGLLREIGVWNRTILVLLSDHGEEFWDHGSVLHAHSVFQEVLRVPLIVHLPEGARAGTRVAEPVRLLDVAPTLYDLVRLPIPPAVQGTSLAARMQGKDARAPASMAQGGSASAWIDYPWKLIETRSGERGEWSAALYDLSSDPKETMDVASQNPDVVARLRQELALTLARRASRRAD